MVAAWDIVAKSWYRLQKQSQAPAAPATSAKPATQIDELVSKSDICTRLFDDYLKREARYQSIQEALAAEAARKRLEESAPKYTNVNPVQNAERQRAKLEQLREEHEKLREVWHHLLTLEGERRALQQPVVQRDPIPLRNTDMLTLEHHPLSRDLCLIGSKNINAPSIATLLQHLSEAEILALIDRLKGLKSRQQNIIAGEQEIQVHERLMLDDLKDMIKQEFDRAIPAVIEQQAQSSCSYLLQRRLDGSWEWTHHTEVAAAVIEQTKYYLTHACGKVEEFAAERRRILSDALRLHLQNVIAAVELDVEVLNMFVTLNVPPMHVRGYRYDLVENMKETEWFKRIGSTTSLRNNHIINKSVKDIMEEVGASYLPTNPSPTELPASIAAAPPQSVSVASVDRSSSSDTMMEQLVLIQQPVPRPQQQAAPVQGGVLHVGESIQEMMGGAALRAPRQRVPAFRMPLANLNHN